MQKKMILTVPELCHENWDKMNPTEKGRFCLSCNKEVIDFTLMTDAEILSHLQKKQGSTCGNFFNDQLQRPLAEASKRNPYWKYLFRLMIPAFLISQKTKAQVGKLSVNYVHSIPYMPAETSDDKSKSLTSSRVLDANTGQEIPFANITVKGSEKVITTDSSGSFHISTGKKKVEIEISHAGYETLKSFYQEGDESDILLKQDSKVMHEVVIVTPYVTGRLRRSTGLVYTVSKTDSISIFKKITDTVLNKNQVRCYPNPVQKGAVINIDMKNIEQGDYQLALFSSNGAVVKADRIRVPEKIFLFQWSVPVNIAAGTYILRITASNGKIAANKKITIL